jgi:hypothetical protein
MQVFTVACGRSFTTCITMDGELFAWGINVHGECGLGPATPKGVYRLFVCACGLCIVFVRAHVLVAWELAREHVYLTAPRYI